MGCFRTFRALLWKNVLLKTRSPCASCCEVLLPIVFVLLIAGLFRLSKTNNYDTSAYTPSVAITTPNTYPNPFSGTQRVLPLSILPFRLAYSNQKLAIAPQTPAAQPYVDSLLAYISTTFPAFNGSTAGGSGFSTPALRSLYIPSLASQVQTFASEAELASHIKDAGYRDGGGTGIWGAIVVNAGAGVGGGRWDYSIRMNSSTVPVSNAQSAVNILQRGVNLKPVQQYAWSTPPSSGPPFLKSNLDPLAAQPFPGFLSLQLLMDRFILNRPVPLGNLDATQALSSFAAMLPYAFPPGVFLNATAELAGASPALQAAILQWIGTPESYAPQQVDLVPFPTFAYSNTTLFAVLSFIFALFMLLTYLLPLSRLIRGVVMEKESKISEGMRMMGMQSTALLGSWVVLYGVIYLVISVLVSLILHGAVFKNSSGPLLFVLFLFFGLSSLSFAYLISVFFSRARTASTVGVILYLGAFFPYYAVNSATDSFSAKVGASLLAPTSFALGIGQLCTYEQQGAALTQATANDMTGNYTFSASIYMMFIDIFLYLLLAWYADAVLPSWAREFGVPRPFYFPCMPSYWAECCGCSRRSSGAVPSATAPGGAILAAAGGSGGGGSAGDGRKHNLDPADASYFEAPDSAQQAMEREGRCVQFVGVRKEFGTPDGVKVAVDDLNLTFYAGQITCLLGHNGAGKSTAINMLTGLYPPTSGHIRVFGRDVREDNFASLFASLGVVSQQDVLWPELTVREHLQLFATVKSVPRKEAAAAMLKVIQQVGLTEKIDAQSGQLSGGQKRKLMLAIALLGGSKVIILDEVTSGMDPFSRRSTWQAIQEAKREGRTILMSTHFLEEADLLGDRIAIMAEGSARCAGSGMFLKQRFGLGYTLTVVKADHGVAVDAIVATLRAHVPSVAIAGDAGQELKLTLPLESSSSFEPMFAALDAAREALGVVAYGMSITTLEDVFLRAADDPSALLPGHGHGSHAGGAQGGRGSAAGGDKARGATAVVVNVAHSDRTLAALTAAGDTPSDGSHGSGSTTYGTASIAVGASGAVAGGTVKNGMPDAAVAAGGAALSVSEMRRRARTELVGCSGFCKHVYAIILKRAAFARRDLRTLLCQVLIPVVLVVGGLALIGLAQGLSTQPSLQLSTAYFNNDPRKFNAAPIAPNYLPYAAYKTGPGGAAAAADVAAFLAGIPSANASLSTAAPAFALSASAAAATVDKYGFATAGAGSPLGDWQNASTWLLGNVGSVSASVYGAVLFEGGPGTMVPGQSAASVFPTGGDNALTYTVMHNTTSQLSAPLYVNLVNSAAYARATGAADASITARTYPLPLTKLESALFNSALTGVAALLIMIAFSFLPASYAAFIVRERECGAKHQQLISGVSISAYWLANFAFDVLTYLIPGVLAIALCFAFQINEFTTSAQSAVNAMVGLFLLFGPAAAATTYVLSFAFRSASAAQNTVLFINIGCVILLFASIIMGALGDPVCKIDDSLRYVWRLMPIWSLGQGLYQLGQLATLPAQNIACWGRASAVIPTSGVDMSVTGWNMLYLGLLAPAFLGLAILIDQFLARPYLRAKLMRDPQLPETSVMEDDDVVAERARVSAAVAHLRHGGASSGGGSKQHGGGSTTPNSASSAGSASVHPATPAAGEDSMLIHGLRKVYPAPNKATGPKVAVRNLSFGVEVGQVFGFLGINGAGKSTTLSILSGDALPTAGTAKLAGYDVLAEQSQVRRLLGYCPQQDPLLEVLTAREHLELYARIKGVPEARLKETVDTKLAELDLTQFANKKAGSLSGGNKRKLVVACALIGNPLLIFLDEPSTGMDPKARRFMWSVINRIATQEKLASVVLTSHAMEEVEALCGRVGIMVGGMLQCIGSIQHLKSKFGRGYQCEVRLHAPAPAVSNMLTGRALAVLGAAAQVQGPSGPVVLLRRDRVAAVCHALGDTARVAWLTEDGPGWAIHSAFGRSVLPSPTCSEAERAIPLADFVAWWAEEDAVARLVAALTGAFPGAALVERQGLTARFKLPAGDASLGAMFGRIEGLKGGLGVDSYSLSQVTLEQVFNGFAGGTLNPETGRARGLAGAAGAVAAGSADGGAGAAASSRTPPGMQPLHIARAV